jgi:hypothetical protein
VQSSSDGNAMLKLQSSPFLLSAFSIEIFAAIKLGPITPVQRIHLKGKEHLQLTLEPIHPSAHQAACKRWKIRTFAKLRQANSPCDKGKALLSAF